MNRHHDRSPLFSSSSQKDPTMSRPSRFRAALHALRSSSSSSSSLTSRRLVVAFALVTAGLAVAAGYVAADQTVLPAVSSTAVLPEKFLRGFDPITVVFADDTGPGPGPADDATGLASLKPAWPGAWTWSDKRTLQFRPAEPWPALSRFAVEAKGANKVLSTMMTAPQAMQPADGSTGLPPFRTLTLTFPQPLALDALQKMIRLEVRDLPGLSDQPRQQIEKFSLALLPRADQKDPATYAISFDGDVGEGKMLVVTVALALADVDGTLWTGRASTRTDFRLEEVQCAGLRLGVTGSPKAPREQALDCGNAGQTPQLVFSAPVNNLSLTALKKLVRLEPSVPDLKPTLLGRYVQLDGRFVPDTLYRLQIADAPVFDDLGRRLQNPGTADVYFFVGWKKPFLRMKRGALTAEAKGPRMVPLVGYGDAKADVRIHRIDPLHLGLWPFPQEPVVVDESSEPPFPGDEPTTPTLPSQVSRDELVAHVRLLGAPIVSRVVDLPLSDKGGTTSFGLDVGRLLDGEKSIGSKRPGTYLVGVRRLQGSPERSWARVQLTNLSVTAVEERGQAVFFVRALDTAAPVDGAKITFDAIDDKTGKPVQLSLSTDASGRARLPVQPSWRTLSRVVVQKADDVFVVDPGNPPSRFADNHWSSGSSWLSSITSTVPAPKNDATLGFLFTERPIYRPGEKVFLKGFVREKRGGVLSFPTATKNADGTPGAPPKLSIKVSGPGDATWVLPTTTTALFGGDAVWQEKSPPTGSYTAELFIAGQTTALATRRFQVEAYRLPTFELQLTGPVTARLDQPFSVRALARYYAGGNVAGQPVRWTITRRPAWHVPKGREGFLFASSAQFARNEARSGEEQTTREATLSDDGADVVEVNPQKDIDGSPRTYRFEATVKGADDQEVSAVTEVTALPPFSLGMKLVRFAKSASSVDPEIIAVGVDDALVDGQKVEVRLYKRTWHSHLRESHFATGEANYVTEQEDKKLAEQTITTKASGPVKVALPVAGAGVYVVELAARDKLGRVQTLSADLYIGGKEPVAWAKGQAGVFELVPDKVSPAKYRPGDTANIVVKSPFNKASALVIVERAAGNEYKTVDVDGGTAVVPVSIDKSATPNLPVHVVLTRGRLGDSDTDDAPYRPQTAAASIDLEVEPSKNLVKVELSHPQQARPGSTIDMTVALKDDAGAPVAGEVTLWLVDEAVLALAKEGVLDPLTAMIVRNERDTTVTDTRNQVIGRVIEDEAPGGDGGDEGDGTGTARRRVRKDFQTVPYWQATLPVPASGKLTVKIPLSDDLTNFAIRAVAVAGAERFGNAASKIRVRLPVLVQPQLPRFVRQGDRFDGGGVARLVEGDGGPGVVKAEYAGPVVERKRSKDITLQPNKAESVTFPVEVKSTASGDALTVKMEVYRKKDGTGDAFEVKIPVLPDTTPRTVAFVDDIGAAKKALSFPTEAARAGTMNQSIVATNVPGLFEVVGALEYLDAYPHGCLEQKMARLAPQLAIAGLAKRLGGFTYAEGVRAQVERLLVELPTYQTDKGLLGYWPGSPGDVQLTGDTLEFLAMAEQQKIVVDKALKARAQDALKAVLRSDYAWGSWQAFRPNLQTGALRALVRSGDVDEHYLADLMRTRSNLDATSRADLALAMLGKSSMFAGDLQTLKAELWSSVTFQLVDGQRVVAGVNDPRSQWGSAFLGSSTSSLATVLEALVRLDPQNADLAPLAQAVLKRGAGQRGFGSTYDNRRAVAALSTWLDKAMPDAPSTKLVVNDRTFHLDGAAKVARYDVDATTAPQAQATGQPVRARVRYRYLPETPGDRQAAQKAGFLVERSMTIYAAGVPEGTAPQRLDDVRAAERTLTTGDVVEIHARFTIDKLRHNIAFVVPFAAGLEPMNPALATASADAQPAERDSTTPLYVERLDHEVRYYFSSLPAGTYTFHFRAKATTPGSFVHPGAHAELMYDDGVRGSSDGMRVVIARGSNPTTDDE
jgi:uncharacterized protein YfaS (alpha-2-macroglobulin family)